MVDLWSALEPFVGPLLKLLVPYAPSPNYGYVLSVCSTIFILVHNHKLERRVTAIEIAKSHTMFVQTNPVWSGLKLGRSPLSMGRYGCVTTAVAESLRLAGYEVDPGVVCAALSAQGGYTAGGLIIWDGVTRSFPQWAWAFGSARPYRFVQLSTPAGEHWVLYYQGQYYDPANGSMRGSLPISYKPTGRVISADIVPAPPASPAAEVILAVAEDSVKFDAALRDSTGHASVNLNRRRGGLLSEPVLNVIRSGSKLAFTGKYSFGDGYEWVELAEGGWAAKHLIRFSIPITLV